MWRAATRPLRPPVPAFNTSRDLRMKDALSEGPPSLVVKVGPDNAPVPATNGRIEVREMGREPDSAPIAAGGKDAVVITKEPQPERKRSFLRRAATFLIFLGIFAGVLYGTYAFVRGRGLIPEIRNPFRAQTGVANTDVRLRPDPSTNADAIGLVTKNSRVKIISSQDNWCQIDIIEQGRQSNTATAATRGWINKRFIDMDR